MRYGKFLPEGGGIGFVAPSFGCNIEPYRTTFDHAREIWTRKGYALDLGPNAYEGSGIGISSTPEACAAEFMEWYGRKENDVLISCGGGELMCEILGHIDFAKLKSLPPKWFMGYSDNTNLTFLLPTICDVASIYGPCAATFGMEPWHPSLDDAFAVLKGEKRTVRGYDRWEREGFDREENPLCPYNVTEKRVLRRSPDADCVMTGRLLGGCLDCLENLNGTEFDHVDEFNERYREDGVIWFLEACDLNVMSVRRALWQLVHSGWFRYTKGFLIGRPYHYGEEAFGLTHYEAAVGALSRFQVPIIMDVDIGHLPPMMPLVCGSLATVTVRGNDIQIEMEYC